MWGAGWEVTVAPWHASRMPVAITHGNTLHERDADQHPQRVPDRLGLRKPHAHRQPHQHPDVLRHSLPDWLANADPDAVHDPVGISHDHLELDSQPDPHAQCDPNVQPHSRACVSLAGGGGAGVRGAGLRWACSSGHASTFPSPPPPSVCDGGA